MGRETRSALIIDVHSFIIIILLAFFCVSNLTCSGQVDNLSLEAREEALKTNLQVLRTTLETYRAEKGVYPSELQELIEEGYLKVIPIDPITGTKEHWILKTTPEGAIEDVASASERISREGSRYSDW